MPSEIDLTTVATAAEVLRTSASDAQLARMISAASALVANMVGYRLHRRTVTDRPETRGTPYVWLSTGAVETLDALTLDGRTMDASEYLLDDARDGRILRLGGVWPFRGTATSGVWPVRLVPVAGALVVEATAGYVTPGQHAMDPLEHPEVTLPPELEQAALEVLSCLWASKGRDPSVRSIALGGGSYSWDTTGGAATALVSQLISAHRRASSFVA